MNIDKKTLEFLKSITGKRARIVIDHRIPYEIGGDEQENAEQEYMPFCASCNRAKSWSCEHCPNWEGEKLENLCNTCYWTSPDEYKHIALEEARRLDILWTEEKEIAVYEKIKNKAKKDKTPMPEYMKKIINKSAKF